MNLREIRWEDVDWKHMTEGRDHRGALIKEVMNLRVP
jgi:hypothetical protein